MKNLDLHGKRHDEVYDIVENFILVEQNNFPFKIITGNSVMMQKIVREVLDKYYFRYSYESSTNLGAIIIWGFLD